MKTFIQIVLGVFTILAALYGVNTAQSALKAARERPPEMHLTMPVVHDRQLAQKVDNSVDRLKGLDQRFTDLEKSVRDLADKYSGVMAAIEQVKPVVEEPKVEPPPVVEPNKVLIDQEDPKAVNKYQYLLFSLPDNQCPACVVLKRELDNKDFKDKYELVPSSKARLFGVRYYPSIAVYDPAKNTYRKFQAAGLSTEQVVLNIKDAITILERP